MNNNTISTRQLCFILAFFVPVNKLILLPSLLSSEAKNDLVLSALAAAVLQSFAVFAMLWLMQKRKETLYDLIKGKFNETTARIFYFILAAYFLFSAILPAAEHKVYIETTMYDTLPSPVIFSPFFIFSTYAAAKGLQCAGRAADAGMPLFLLSFPVLLFMATASTDFTSLLPIGKPPYDGVARGAIYSLSWFSDAAWLLALQGRVTVQKKFLTKTFLSYLAGAATVLVFLAVFYGIFSTVAPNENFAVAKVARYYNALKTVGRIDLLFIYVLSVVQLFALIFPLQLCTNTLACACRSNKTPIFSLITNGILFLVIFFTDKAFPSLLLTVTGKLFPVFLVFANLIPMLCPLFTIKKRERRTTDAA